MAKPRTVGARELKTRLGSYLRRVKAGETLIITDRGEPAAELRPVEAATDATAALRRMEADGLITIGSGKPLRRFKPLRLVGRRLSETIRENREDRF